MSDNLHSRNWRWPELAVLSCALALHPACAENNSAADDPAPPPPPPLVANPALPVALPDASADEPARLWKFTAGRYHYSAGSPGDDLNLRYTAGDAHVWLGNFRQPGAGVGQWRAGWDQSFFSQVRVQPSLQAASGGFLGGSLGLETGAHLFIGAGLGRTNLQPYYNLNFDPNDSWTLATGWRADDGSAFGLLWVRDNRLNPDQRHLHATAQQRLPMHQRLSVDVLYKQGRVNDLMVHRLGATLTYDWASLFLRLAFDPQTNFTPVDAWRLSAGLRF